RSATHGARRQGTADDRSVAAVGTSKLAGDVRSRSDEIGEPRVVDRQLERRLRRLVDLNPYVQHYPFVLREGATPCAPRRLCAHTAPVQTPEPVRPVRTQPERRPLRPERAAPDAGSWGVRLAWGSGLVLALSAFTDWYVGTLPNGLTFAATGRDNRSLRNLVFFLGLAT